MNLDEHNNKWSEFLASENCPPILGLVPLSENDCQEISKLIERTLAELGEHERYNSVVRRLNYNLLAQLINKYPAVLAVWLARKAGESYEAGAFYEKFEEAIGLHLSLAQRAEFAHRFWRACFVAMRDLPRVIDWGSRPHVEKFLFQAGLPLCHCQTFANMLRAVERQFGLPDPEAPDAVEELRDNLLPRSELTPRPTLKRALLGPAGTFLCQAALRVVLEENFAGINPRLGEELAHSFENCTRDQIRRSARQPFVRLAPDYISLELVGPRQDEDLMACSGLVWIVDGERHRVPAFDEFVSHLATQARVSVELRGLVGGQPLLRTFVLDLQQREQPFMLFDYDTRRLRREGAGAERLWHAKSAQYWLLHPTDATVSSSEQRIEWPDGQRVLSLIRIRPGLEVRLEASDQTYVSFKADQSPFFEPTGEVLLTSGDERIHYGWTRLPAVWLPTEEGDEAQSTGWSLRASAAAQEQTWPLHRDSSMPSEGGMLKCLPHGTEFLLQSPSGLHEVELSVFCGSRPKVSERFLLWIGLSESGPATDLSSPLLQ